ncbi:replication initiation factor domain-containing protein [Enterococcus cecorum]|uniref:replication initiation factor domain-containing protein n=1 Tax=Enterococcus cecorum TaxID=44008 RepID=UPI001FAC1F5A|nr:replication initiation factor domain-containing protein [Enterococcus cecorum]MCJ0567911.1 replication initiation factor domain-containing protein [Enterococcus cecorum]
MKKNALEKIENNLTDLILGKRVIINEYDHLKNISMKWSIDRITIVGRLNDNIFYHLENGDIVNIDFEMLMRLNENNGYLEAVGASSWILRDKWNENIAFIEMLKFQQGYGRIDFNPNKIKAFLHSSLKNFIHDLFLNPHFSRADVACDIFNVDDSFISQYRICEPVKTHFIHARSGALETAYFGSSGSEKQVRMYNKKVEQLKKRKILPPEINTWWRVEIQLRRNKATEWFENVKNSLSNFMSPHFMPNTFSGIERCVIKGLISDENEWDNLTRSTKYKYKKMMLECVKNDEITQNMLVTFEKSANELKDELDSWLLGLQVGNEDGE